MSDVKIIELGTGNFDDFMSASKKLIVVEFYTSTCPVCKSMVPVYQEVANDLDGKAEFTRVNSSTNMQLALRLGIMGVPAFKFFCGGKEVGGIVGATNTTALANTVKDFIRHAEGCKSTPLIYEIDGYA